MFVEPEARHAHKTVHRRQDGFKAHIAVEPDTGLVTACRLSKASGADSSDATVGKPIPVRAPVPDGFTAHGFTVDHTTGTVTCPNGLTRTISPSGKGTFGTVCSGCPLRARCTYAETDAFSQPYRQHRPMVEGSIAWLVRGENRKVRYRGMANNDLWLHHRLAGLNLRRLLNLGLHQQHGAWALA